MPTLRYLALSLVSAALVSLAACNDNSATTPKSPSNVTGGGGPAGSATPMNPIGVGSSSKGSGPPASTPGTMTVGGTLGGSAGGTTGNGEGGPPGPTTKR